MKKFTILFFTIMMTAWQGTAQVVTVGNGSGGTQIYPLGNYYGYERSASIYHASEINQRGVITSVAWYAEIGGKGSRPIKIYLKETTLDRYTDTGTWSEQISGATLVFDASLTPVEGWNTITLSTPFVFNADNLEVLVEANYGGTGNGGGTDGNRISYDSFSHNDDLHVFWHQNNDPPTHHGTKSTKRPQVQLVFGGAYVYYNEAWTPGDPSGVSTAADDILIVNGTTEFTANTNVKNVIVRSGATLEIGQVLNLFGNLTNEGNLVFLSNATGNGELGPVPANSVITGNATVQRYTTNVRSYRMVSSAVTSTTSINANWQEGVNNTGTEYPVDNKNPNDGFGTHITGSLTGANGLDATLTGAASMFTVNIGTQEFESILNTKTRTLIAGEPYLLMVRGSRIINLNYNDSFGSTVLRATGKLAKGDQVQNFTQATDGQFVMFGNPYQSAVDMVSVFSHSTNLNTNYYYIYDPNAGTDGIGAYVTVDLNNGGNTIEDGGSSSANKYLQPGQGAQVKVTGNATILFKESDKAPGNFTDTNRPLSGSDKLSVQLYSTESYNNNGRILDGLVIRFAAGYDNNLTEADAIKPFNFTENLGIDLNGTYLSIEQREIPRPNEVFQLYTTGYQKSDYILKLNLDGVDATSLYLEDNFTGTSTLLDQGENSYDFSVDKNIPASIATDRFSIRTEQRLGVDNPSLLDGIRLFPNPINDNVFNITAPKLNGETTVISVNDMLGREVMSSVQIFSGNTLKVELPADLNSGIYMVTISANGESQSLRVIKR